MTGARGLVFLCREQIFSKVLSTESGADRFTMILNIYERIAVEEGIVNLVSSIEVYNRGRVPDYIELRG